MFYADLDTSTGWRVFIKIVYLHSRLESVIVVHLLQVFTLLLLIKSKFWQMDVAPESGFEMSVLSTKSISCSGKYQTLGVLAL